MFHGRYRVQRCIKAGGMGAVYEVVDENTDSARALKVMLPSLVADTEHRGRFALEAKVTGGIESDHLVRVSDAGVDEASGTPFLVMDLLRGEELAQLLARRKALSPGEVVLYLHQAALALDKTHGAGIVHRDLKPENLFLTHRDDGSPCVKILDFGIAKVVQQNQSTDSTRALGTPLYMAPEQIKGMGTIGPRADLYALAQIAYTLLSGEPYWAEDAKSAETLFPLLAKIVTGATEPASVRARRRAGVALPATIDAWFVKASSPNPEARFDRATAQVLALAQAAGVSSPTPSLSTAVAAITGSVVPPGALAYAPAQPVAAAPSPAPAPAPVSLPSLPSLVVPQSSATATPPATIMLNGPPAPPSHGPPSHGTVTLNGPPAPPSSGTITLNGPPAPPSHGPASHGTVTMHGPPTSRSHGTVKMSAVALAAITTPDSGPTHSAVTASVNTLVPVPAPAAGRSGGKGILIALAAVALVGVGGLSAVLLMGRTAASPAASQQTTAEAVSTGTSAPSAVSTAAPATPPEPAPVPSATVSAAATVAAETSAAPSTSASAPRAVRQVTPVKSWQRGPGAAVPPPPPAGPPQHEGIF